MVRRSGAAAVSVADAREEILAVAEVQLRRFGVDKVTVVDIAKALGMSHANVYRFFPSKSAIIHAVVGRWVAETVAICEAAMRGRRTAAKRIEAMLVAIFSCKRAKLANDPEVFQSYTAMVEVAPEVIADYTDRLAAFLARVVQEGIESGEFAPTDAQGAARQIWQATERFHHPVLVRHYQSIDDENALKRVVAMLTRGLAATSVPP